MYSQGVMPNKEVCAHAALFFPFSHPDASRRVLGTNGRFKLMPVFPVNAAQVHNPLRIAFALLAYQSSY